MHCIYIYSYFIIFVSKLSAFNQDKYIVKGDEKFLDFSRKIGPIILDSF